MSSGSSPTSSEEIREGHKHWKDNVQHLYDLVVTHNLEWPSLTVEWLPGVEEPEAEHYSAWKLILGTHAAENEQNSLLLAQLKLPRDDWEGDDPEVVLSSTAGIGKVEIVQRIKHDGVVNRARYMPQNPSIIATKTGSTEVFIFDYTKHPSNPPGEGACNPELRLTGHKDIGYALSWSPFKQGHLLSGSVDGQVCMWDVNATPNDKTLEPMHIFDLHDGSVEDVAWNMKDKNLFGSVGEDKYLRVWDIRTPVIRVNQSVLAHDDKINSLAFNPISEWVVATGSSDRKVILFDLRNISSPFHILEWPNQKEVAHVRWNYNLENVLASSCAGRRVVVWDLYRIGHTQTSEEAEEGPPELLFLHGGHMSRITDFSWSPSSEWVVASASDDSKLQIWEMADHVYEDEDDLPGHSVSDAPHPKSPQQMDPPAGENAP